MHRPQTPGIEKTAFERFFSSGSAGGVLLIMCVVISLIIANSSGGPSFEGLLSFKVGIKNNFVNLRYPLILWINDGLMAVFFLLIGLEIKRELTGGELSSLRNAILPVFAAIGGAAVPAVIYWSVNAGTPASAGWGIPMATDIAFALSVLSLLGSRVPPSLKILLAALAIVDDLIAILVIAIFYSSQIYLMNLLYVAILFGVMMLFNRLNFRSLWFYLLPGVVIWYLVHHSGIHATIAGVITAAAIPSNTDQKGQSPSLKLEHFLNKPVNFLIMPLFALANTNIRVEQSSIEMLTSGMSIGIIAGLVLGKPAGIALLSWITIRLKWSGLPDGTHWRQMIGLGMLGGIGFTMSIFIALLSFGDPILQTASKLAILIGSAVAGVTGYGYLYFIGGNNAKQAKKR